MQFFCESIPTERGAALLIYQYARNLMARNDQRNDRDVYDRRDEMRKC